MVLFYALMSALTYGAADFLGGLSTRKNSVLTVVAWSQGIGLLTALIAAPLLGADPVPFTDILWGVAAGISGAAGVGFLYRGLATGLASVVSPVAALTGAALPVFFGLIIGEKPSLLTWGGVILAVPAILFLTLEKEEGDKPILPSLKMGLLAGAAFSGFFILISRSGEGSGMWPLLAARSVTVPLFLLLVLIRKEKLRPEKGTEPQIVFSGILDMLANIFYLLAARTGYLILAVILTALYPAPTVFFQNLFLKERLTKARIAGLFLAIAGAALIGIGG